MNSPINPHRFSEAARAGLRVFPVLPNDKRPALAWTEFHTREPTRDELETWDRSDFNVGIICGAPSGIIVLDVDSASAQALVDSLDLPKTPTVKTQKGQHYYWKMPSTSIRNKTKISGEHLDLRGDGGYVVGSGSIHESGHEYCWDVSPADVPFAEIPESLLTLIGKPEPRRLARSNVAIREPIGQGRFSGWLARHVSEAVEKISAAGEGQRNDTLFRIGVQLAEDVAGAGEDWPSYADVLRVKAQEIGLTESEIEATLASCWKSGSQQPTRWMNVARAWIYLAKPDVFYHVESGEYLTAASFNNMFMQHRVEKGPLSRFLLQGEFILIVHDRDYRPCQPMVLTQNRLSWFNTFRPSSVTAEMGDASPFVDFLKYLVPEEFERSHLIKMMSWTVRYPGEKLGHALLFRSRAQGIGKTMLTEIWAELMGRTNVRKTTTEEVSGQYQGYIKEKTLVILEELNWGVGPSGYNRMKDLITGTEVSVNEKFINVRMWPNYATFVILTNVRTPIILEDRDRRFFFIDSPAEKREPKYYNSFVAWWHEHLGVIRHYLDSVDLTDFNPHEAPPMTEAKRVLIADSRTDLVKDLAHALEERAGIFRRDIVTLKEIEIEMASSMRGASRSKLVEALDSLGAVSFRQQRIPRVNLGGQIGGADRASLWAIRNSRYWESAGTAERGAEYRRIDGLLTDFAPLSSAHIDIRHMNDWPPEIALK